MSAVTNKRNDNGHVQPEATGTAHLRSPTPLPKLQLFILLYLQLAEPIMATLIYPFINQLIFEYGITNGDRAKVGYYAGSVSSLFFLTEMALALFGFSCPFTRIGRRPVLLTGLCGLVLSITCFGLSKTFLALMLSRALSGALNGNNGVMKSMMAEITDETNQAQAFSFTPLVWNGGSSLASFIGGGLSHPYERFPGVFGHSKFWKDYPYALPCFTSAIFSVSAFILAFLFLEETLESKRKYFWTRKNGASRRTSTFSETSTPIETTTLLGKATTTPEPPPLREVLTPLVRLSILNYGSYALLNVVYVWLQPLFMSTPISLGGLGLQPPTIGLILGLTGIANSSSQMLFFAPLHRRFGTKNLFMVAITANFVLYLCWPIMNILAKRSGKVDAAVIVVLSVQLMTATLSGMGFSCTHIFIISAAPTRNSLGATTGLSQSFASLTRAVGPAAMSSLFAVSVQYNLLGGRLVYLVLILFVALALIGSSRLPKVVKRVSDQLGD